MKIFWFVFIIFLTVCTTSPARADKANPESVVSNVTALAPDKEYPDYESQVLDIFQDLIDHPAHPRSGAKVATPYPVFPADKATALLKKYVQKIKNNQMHLKNVVFRTDNTRAIRMTWGDKDDDYLFKIAYDTSMDRVLRNSLYADKDKIPDIKLIYHEEGKLKYVWIYHKKERKAVVENAVTEEHISDSRPENYVMYYNMAQRCDFCHELAKHDGSKTGLFFQRYQYKNHFSAADEIEKTDSLFQEESFKLTKKSDSFIAKALGDRMPDQFYYQRVPAILASGEQSPMQAVLREMPELLDVLAQDNGKSYCMSLLYAPGQILTNENYFCSDVEKKKLYVHFENPWSLKEIPPGTPREKIKAKVVDYEKDFWAEPVMPVADTNFGYK